MGKMSSTNKKFNMGNPELAETTDLIIQEYLDGYIDLDSAVASALSLTHQIQGHNPSPRFTEVSVTGARDYLSNHGKDSWEQNALEPKIISNLISGEIEINSDDAKWEATLERKERA